MDFAKPEQCAGERRKRGNVDNLSKVHFKTVWAEIQGRFFSPEEAQVLKNAIDKATITDAEIRAEAAKSWPEA